MHALLYIQCHLEGVVVGVQVGCCRRKDSIPFQNKKDVLSLALCQVLQRKVCHFVIIIKFYNALDTA